MVINRIITFEGRFSTYKTCHFRLLSHFEFGKLINSPFYFWRSLGKMASQVRKNTKNPTHSLYHHGLIKILIVAKLKKQNHTWDQFLYAFSISHVVFPVVNDVEIPPTSNHPIQSSSLNLNKNHDSMEVLDSQLACHGQKREAKDRKKGGRVDPEKH